MPANDSITETTQMAMTAELRKVRKRLRSARELLAGVETMIAPVDKSCLQLTCCTAWLSDLAAPSSHVYAPCSLLRQSPATESFEVFVETEVEMLESFKR